MLPFPLNQNKWKMGHTSDFFISLLIIEHSRAVLQGYLTTCTPKKNISMQVVLNNERKLVVETKCEL